MLNALKYLQTINRFSHKPLPTGYGNIT